MLRSKILETIKEMDDAEIVRIWNEYCYNTNHYDDEILDADGLETYAEGQDALFLVYRFFYGRDEHENGGSANPNRNYFCFNGYGNIISFDYPYNSYTDEFYNIDIDDLLDYIIDEHDALYNDDIEAIFEDMEAIEND